MQTAPMLLVVVVCGVCVCEGDVCVVWCVCVCVCVCGGGGGGGGGGKGGGATTTSICIRKTWQGDQPCTLHWKPRLPNLHTKSYIARNAVVRSGQCSWYIFMPVFNSQLIL